VFEDNAFEDKGKASVFNFNTDTPAGSYAGIDAAF